MSLHEIRYSLMLHISRDKIFRRENKKVRRQIMGDELSPKDKVITTAITDGPNRKTWPKFTKVSDLSPSLQKRAK